MSYRTYLKFKTEDNELEYQIFGNNDYFDEVMNYVCSGDKQKYKKLEKNDFDIRNFEIKDFYDFCYKVIFRVAKNELKEYNEYYNIERHDKVFIAIKHNYAEKSEKEPVVDYLSDLHYRTWNALNNNYLLEFYNLIEFMAKNKLINTVSFKLKPDMKIFLEAF